ncbi:Membrane protein ptm1 [Entomophthora muscae]|uniref:Membrane protein ptm1 n=1 Tax=Entomophthora muscae TaxID=34485 RepID=A0ACC2TRI4_9FUNG|nr:Membrane protein ptm1 [Entomophthora muscae]
MGSRYDAQECTPRPIFPNGEQANVTIKVKLPDETPKDGKWGVAFAFLDYKDFYALGYSGPLGFGERKFICTTDAVMKDKCLKEELGHFVINNRFKVENSTIQTFFRAVRFCQPVFRHRHLSCQCH